MPSLSLSFLLFVIASLFYAYLNGVTDSANIVAPVVSSRAISRRQAALMTALAVLVAPFIFGVAVARTFGAGILAPAMATLPIVNAATFSAIVWRWLTWRLALPSSNSHALVGGLVGAGLAGAGLAAINLAGLLKVFAALFFSPAIGLVFGFLATRLVYYLAHTATPRVNHLFRQLQVLTAFVLGLSWGANDAQKTVGLLALGLAVATGRGFTVPVWTISAAMAAVALGTLFSGWRLIRTLGGRFYRIRPIHGLATQVASAGVIFGAAALGGPVSTTQVVSTAIMGAGAAERVSKVRWSVATDIFWAWVLTVPATALLGAGLYYLLRGALA